MKLLLVNNFFTPFGGGEIVMMGEAALLRESGHEVAFFATDKQPYFESNPTFAEAFPAYHDLRAYSTPQRLLALPNAFYNKKAKASLSEVIRQFQPDLVHIHNLHYHLSPSVLDACSEARVPVVMHAHDIRIVCPSGRFQREEPVFEGSCTTGNPLHCLGKRCKNGSLAETAVSLLEQAVHRGKGCFEKVERFIVPSQAVGYALAMGGISQAKLTHIPNFIDPAYLEQSPSHGDDGSFLFFGRLSAEKGVHTLLEAFATLPEQTLYIAGKGPQEAELRARAEQLKLRNVHFLGALDKSELLGYLARCRASIIPSHWYEPFGLTIIESFALGKAVIGANSGAIPELLHEETAGIVIPRANAEALAQAVRRLANNPELAKAYGQRGRQLVETLYTPEQHRQSLLALYADVLG